MNIFLYQKKTAVRYKFLILLSIFVSISVGCGMKQTFMGDFYLTGEKYQAGIAYFQNEVQKNPNDPLGHYYLGRYYLADHQPEKALTHLERAAELDSSNAFYHFWLGVAYSENKQPDMEIKSYEKSLSLNPDFLQCRIYLAHTQLERKLYEAALTNYSIVLKTWPDEPASLYNRALALNFLGRKKEEKAAWKEYLDFYPSGSMARQAVAHLNALGDFSYRNYVVGPRILTLRKIEFKAFSADLTPAAEESLDFLGEVLTIAKDVSIHVAVYQENNSKLAEQKAKSIKKYLVGRYAEIEPDRIRISWFDVPEKITIDKKVFSESESVNFFTAS